MTEKLEEPLQEGNSIELYPLPNGWKWGTVSDAGAHQKNAIVDGPFGSNLKVSDYVEGGPVPVLTTKNLEGKYDDVRYITKAKFEELKRSAVYPGDILMAKIGSCGKTGIYPLNHPPAMIPANLLKVSLNDQFELKYVYYYFNSSFFQKALRTITKATAQPAFGVTNFRKLPLPYTTRDQQKPIVAEIEKQFSRLDEAAANLKRVKANLRRYKAAVLKAAVEGKLTEDWRKQHPNVEPANKLLERILAERRAKWTGRGNYKQPAAPDVTEIPSLPEGWAWATFEQISSRVTVGHVGPMKHEYISRGVPFLRSQNIRENKFDPEGLLYIPREFHAKLSKSVIHPGDLAVVRSGSVGVTCVIPETLAEANCADLVLIQQPHGLVPQFGAYYMNSLAKRRVEAGKVGVALTHFNTKSVAAMPIPVPPLTEQQLIVAEVERRLSVIEELEAFVQANLTRAGRLRQSILMQAFTGKLLLGELYLHATAPIGH